MVARGKLEVGKYRFIPKVFYEFESVIKIMLLKISLDYEKFDDKYVPRGIPRVELYLDKSDFTVDCKLFK